MIFSLKLVDNDFEISEGGRVSLSVGEQATTDAIQTRVQTELGEWFLDTKIGIPYYNNDESQDGILGSKMQADEISAIFRRQILDVDNVKRIDKFEISYSATVRTASIVASVIVETDNTEKKVVIYA